MRLSRDLWLQVEPLLSVALDMEEGARAAWLAEVDASHPEAAPLLRRMLRTHERAERAHVALEMLACDAAAKRQ